MLVNVGLIKFVRSLSARERLLVVVSGGIGVVVGGLDAVALALVVPTVQFMVGLGESAVTSEGAEWFTAVFDFFGIPFTLTTTLVAVVVITVVRSAFILLESFVNTYARAMYEAQLRSRMYARVMAAEWPFLLRQRVGAVQNALIVECQRAGNALGALLVALGALLSVGIYLVTAFMVSWSLTLMAVAGMATLVFLFRILTRIARRLGVAIAAANTELASEAADGLAGVKILKSHAEEESAVRRFGRAVGARARVEVLTGVNNGIFRSASELAFIGLLLGGLLIATRAMDLEESAVLLFAMLFFRLFQRSRAFQGTIMDFSNLAPSVDIVEGLTRQAAARAERYSGVAETSLDGGVEFKRVSFSYDARARVLDSVDLSIPAGAMVALVGSSGGGKTTIIDLTIGLLTPDEGEITVNGHSLSGLDLQAWRSKLAYVSQDTVLFNDTVAGNIARGRTGVSGSEIRRAAELAQADDFIRAMPDGYDTVIGERGMGVSGGQRQRIALARALGREPDLLILDEATSELDTESEARIQGALDALHGDITVLMAAHRLSTVLSADIVYVLQDGRIAEHGRPADLLAANGIFHGLYSRGQGVAVSGDESPALPTVRQSEDDGEMPEITGSSGEDRLG